MVAIEEQHEMGNSWGRNMFRSHCTEMADSIQELSETEYIHAAHHCCIHKFVSLIFGGIQDPRAHACLKTIIVANGFICSFLQWSSSRQSCSVETTVLKILLRFIVVWGPQTICWVQLLNSLEPCSHLSLQEFMILHDVLDCVAAFVLCSLTSENANILGIVATKFFQAHLKCLRG